MTNIFTKLSDLRKNATKRALLQYNQSTGTKVVKQIIGINPLNKDWVDEAEKKLRYATKQQGFTRVKSLISALDILYYCDWILQYNQTADPQISQQIQKAETMYLNACHSYIESNIHSSKTVVNAFTTLFSAIDALAESNPKMAQQYRQILSRYHSLYTAYEKITELCSADSPSAPLRKSKFNKSATQQIKSLLVSNEAAFRMYPNLKEEITDIIKNRLDECLMDLTDNVEKELSESQPSLNKVMAYFNDFIDTFTPLTDFFHQKRYSTIADKHIEYAKIKKMLDTEYPEWLKVYQYYSLPRKQIEESKVFAVIKSIECQSETLKFNFKEIAELSPSIDTILETLKTLVNKLDKDSIIQYYKIENDLLNAPDNEKKLAEIVRFLKHLTEKLADKNINQQLKTELTRMKTEFMTILDNSVENQIKEFISAPTAKAGGGRGGASSINHFFDKILAFFYDLNDLNKLSHWQSVKKTILKAITEVTTMIETLQKDFDYMNKLPESEAKDTLKAKLSTQIDTINEIIPTMALYQIGAVEEYIKILTDIDIAIKSAKNKHHLQPPQRGRTEDCLLIIDKFTTHNIVIFKKDTISIGRDQQDNDIILKSDWVSSHHCTIDFKTKQIIDNDSTNGTFVVKTSVGRPQTSEQPILHRQGGGGHQKPIKITTYSLDNIATFSPASAFDISITKYDGYYILKVISIASHNRQIGASLLGENTSQYTSPEDKDYIASLLNTDFVWLKKYGSLAIDTMTGKINTTHSALSGGGREGETQIIITADDHFTIIDKENSKSYSQIRENQEISTDRFTICLG